MATQIANTSNLGGTLTGVANLANLFLGSSTTTGGSTSASGTTSSSGGTNITTTESSVAPGAVDALIRSILEGTNGLAAVSGAQRTAGLYNSSTNTLLSNDLAARAAGEAAKLNTKTTQTQVIAPTSQSTTQSQNTTQTAAKNPPVSAGAGIAALGGLQLLGMIPKDMKDKAFGVLTGKTKIGSLLGGDSGSSSASAAPIEMDQYLGTLDTASEFATTGTDGLGQSFAGIDPAAEAQNFAGSSLGSGDGGGGDEVELSSFFGEDGGAGNSITDIGSEFLNDTGDFLSGIGTGIADTVSGIGTSIADWWDDFDFGFADGGLVSADARKKSMEEHMKLKMKDGGSVSDVKIKSESSKSPAPKGYASGGVVTNLADVAYLPNTGLRAQGAGTAQATESGSNDVVISKILRDSARQNTLVRPNAASLNSTSTGPGDQNITSYNSSAGDFSSLISDGPGTNASSDVQATGSLSTMERNAVNSIGGNVLGLSGIPAGGSLIGLLTARNEDEKMASLIQGIATLVAGPIVGAAAGYATSQYQARNDVPLIQHGDGGGSDMGGQDTFADGTPSAYDANNGSDGYGGDNYDYQGGQSLNAHNELFNSGFDPDYAHYARGGEVSGPGTGTSDSIPAMLSDGEYVLPADMVAAIGIDKLDALKAKLHKPASKGRN